MAKNKHSHSRKNRSHKRMRGGEVASAWGGDGWTQFMNSLSLQPGQGAVAANQNTLVPINRANIQKTISGGKRHKRSAKRSAKRGGNIGAVLSQAAVPGALIVMNNALRKRSRRHRHY